MTQNTYGITSGNFSRFLISTQIHGDFQTTGHVPWHELEFRMVCIAGDHSHSYSYSLSPFSRLLISRPTHKNYQAVLMQLPRSSIVTTNLCFSAGQWHLCNHQSVREPLMRFNGFFHVLVHRTFPDTPPPGAGFSCRTFWT
jgi:hypothetical protein